MASMSRKNYVAIAAAVKGVWSHAKKYDTDGSLSELSEEFVIALADVFADDNPRFDRGKFKDTCVPDEEPTP